MDIKFIENVHNFVYKQRKLKYLLPSILTMLSSTCNIYCYSFVNGFNLKHCLKCVLLYLSSDNFYLNIIAWFVFSFPTAFVHFHDTSLNIVLCIVICSCWCCKYANFVNFLPKISFNLIQVQNTFTSRKKYILRLTLSLNMISPESFTELFWVPFNVLRDYRNICISSCWRKSIL